MAWVVDACMVIDVLEDDPTFGAASAAVIDAHGPDGLVLCPVSYAELAPAFEGSRELQDEFLAGVGIDIEADWTREDTFEAHRAWYSYVRQRRGGAVGKRPLADLLIGAFAGRHQGLLTRNPTDFQPFFPELTLRGGEPRS